MGHLWRSSFSSSPPQGCGTQPLREEKEERNWMGWDGMGWEARRKAGKGVADCAVK